MAASAPAIYNEKIMPLFLELSDWLKRTFFMADTGMSQEIEAVFLNLSQSMGQFISDFSVKGVKWISGGCGGHSGICRENGNHGSGNIFHGLRFSADYGFFHAYGS